MKPLCDQRKHQILFFSADLTEKRLACQSCHLFAFGWVIIYHHHTKREKKQPTVFVQEILERNSHYQSQIPKELLAFKGKKRGICCNIFRSSVSPEWDSCQGSWTAKIGWACCWSIQGMYSSPSPALTLTWYHIPGSAKWVWNLKGHFHAQLSLK